MMPLGGRQGLSARPPVIVVIPCLNEEEHVAGIVNRLVAEGDRLDLRIIVADGGSTDGSRAIAERMAERDRRVILLDNPRRIQSVAVNRAIDAFGDQAEFLIRIDAHADYPERYCERLLAAQEQTGADSVVVSMHTAGHTCFQRAAAAAQNSLLGHGGSPHRSRSAGRWVDHGHHALMRVAAFKAVGGYDETFSHNEDAELDVRLNAAGYRIYLTGEMTITYFPRRSAPALFRQYRNIGRGRARNFLKHRRLPKVRQLILIGVGPALALLVLAPLSPVFALPALGWAACCLAYGLGLGIRRRDPCAAAAGIAAMATQAGWSLGFLTAILGAAAAAVRPGTRAATAISHAGDDIG